MTPAAARSCIVVAGLAPAMLSEPKPLPNPLSKARKALLDITRASMGALASTVRCGAMEIETKSRPMQANESASSRGSRDKVAQEFGRNHLFSHFL